MNDIARKEYELWRQLCAQLRELNAVTEQDLHSRLSERDTPGKRLLHQIRLWGDARVELDQEESRG